MNCNACGRPSDTDFCLRADCLTYGSGAIVAGPSIRRTVTRCEAEAKRGTGTGACDAPLDEHGNCPLARNHI